MLQVLYPKNNLYKTIAPRRYPSEARVVAIDLRGVRQVVRLDLKKTRLHFPLTRAHDYQSRILKLAIIPLHSAQYTNVEAARDFCASFSLVTSAF